MNSDEGAVAAGPGDSGCPVLLGDQYVVKDGEPLQLVMMEEHMAQHGGYVVKDLNGKKYFQIKNHMMSHELLDTNGDKIAELVKKKLAMRITYHIYTRGGGGDNKLNERRATLNLRAMSTKKKAHVYVYEPSYDTRDDPTTDLDSLEPMLMMQANTSGNVITDVDIHARDDEARLFAKLSKADAEEALESKTRRQFLLTVQPGVDFAFMVLCTIFFNSALQQEGGEGGGICDKSSHYSQEKSNYYNSADSNNY